MTSPTRPLFLPTLAAVCLLLAVGAGPSGAQGISFVDAVFDGDIQGALTVDGLNFTYATAVSPDGAHVYACSGNGGLISSDNAIAVFARASTGRLTFVEAEFDDDDSNDPGTADGLFGCRDVVVSPDGKHVYTAAASENEVGIFSRNAATGALTFSGIVKDGVGSVQALAAPESIAISPDGSAVFVAARVDDAVVAFSRNAMTGALTFADVVQDGVGGVVGLDRPLSVTVSPDGAHVYAAAGSTGNFTGSDAVTVFSWDGAMGDLTFVDAYFEGETQGMNTIDGLNRVSGVTLSPDGKHLYATGGLDVVAPIDHDWIAIFSRDSATGELTWVDSIDHFLFCSLDVLFEFETYAVVHPDGDRVFITSGATALTEFARNSVTGALSFVDGECFFDALGDGVDIGINLPRKISLDPTGRHIYVPGNASNAVAVFGPELIFTDGFESGDVSAWSDHRP